MDLRKLVDNFSGNNCPWEQLKKAAPEFGIYDNSIRQVEDCYLFIFNEGYRKRLAIIDRGSWPGFSEFNGEVICHNCFKIKVAELNHENACILRKVFPFTAPSALGRDGTSIGLGDRLGIASPGHLRLLKNTNIKPVIAQQSVRELTLTSRSFKEVLDSATWAVFQEGYKSGYGADGDHLKEESEVKTALDEGFTMITLDCSNWINNDAVNYTDQELNQVLADIPSGLRSELEKIYIDGVHYTGEHRLHFDEKVFWKQYLTYCDAIRYIRKIYLDYILPAGRQVDLEVSIDEIQETTTPEVHYLVASELIRAGVSFNSLAPKFCGEFQKGIDYIGDRIQFENEFKKHAAIADKFGYKLSLHSGSDKFSIFPTVGYWTGGRLHVKTSGTNWLEALKVIAKTNPPLFRELYAYALKNLCEAKNFYHVMVEAEKLPALDNYADEKLIELFDQDDSRQLMHITCGMLLDAYYKEIFSELTINEELYYEYLKLHIGKHIEGIHELISD